MEMRRADKRKFFGDTGAIKVSTSLRQYISNFFLGNIIFIKGQYLIIIYHFRIEVIYLIVIDFCLVSLQTHVQTYARKFFYFN